MVSLTGRREVNLPAGSNLTRRKNLLRKQLQLNISKSLGALDLVSILFGSWPWKVLD